jgi:hypothetical protein
MITAIAHSFYEAVRLGPHTIGQCDFKSQLLRTSFAVGLVGCLSALMDFPTLHGTTPQFINFIIAFCFNYKPHHAEILGRRICFRDIAASGQIVKLGNYFAKCRYVRPRPLNVIRCP